ncbi:MAG TPA: pilus assembly protein TadG-related protein, partial [Gammaproteobacteria bacterium]
MRRFSSDTGQHGYVLVMLVLVLVVLLGIAALALDLGRLYVLRTEMQNAVDAAALAAAAELNAQEGALTRAEAAGRGLIQSDSHFAAADDKALLGEGDDIGFEFFTSIAPKTPTTNYADAHYVRVTLDPALDEDGESGRYGIDLFFLPVLNVLNIPTQRFVELTASALAGRHFYMCNYPPMMICDPLEAEGGLKENMDAGQQIVLKKQGGGSTWGIGMFGFLYPVDPETGEFLP